ncbi:MAG: HAMP domain-containing histidine kinase, partial [Acidobacteria bacterium]|nr:HAMP domain-containing histidine kinase [Acidobacteriota bacterium]
GAPDLVQIVDRTGSLTNPWPEDWGALRDRAGQLHYFAGRGPRLPVLDPPLTLCLPLFVDEDLARPNLLFVLLDKEQLNAWLVKAIELNLPMGESTRFQVRIGGAGPQTVLLGQAFEPQDGRLDIPIGRFQPGPVADRLVGFLMDHGPNRPPFRERDGMRRRWNQDGPGLFILEVAYPKGSVEKVLAGLRLRQSLFSLGLLSLLAWVVFLLVRSERQARLTVQSQNEFVAQISHEILTPVAAIRSMGQNLADGLAGSAEKQRQYGEFIVQNSRRLGNMVEQVLHYSKIEVQPLNRQWVNVKDLAESLEQALRALHGDHFTWNWSGDDHATIWVEESGIYRALLNLLDNALKHGSPDWVQLAFSISHKNWLFEVTDHGPGLVPDEMERVWEPFFRGTRTRSAQIPGSGLGLALVKRIVEGHGGRVSVKSASLGTCFSMHIPIVEKENLN